MRSLSGFLKSFSYKACKSEGMRRTRLYAAKTDGSTTQ